MIPRSKERTIRDSTGNVKAHALGALVEVIRNTPTAGRSGAMISRKLISADQCAVAFSGMVQRTPERRSVLVSADNARMSRRRGEDHGWSENAAAVDTVAIAWNGGAAEHTPNDRVRQRGRAVLARA
ncbi:hypothetical protein MTO96_049648 [Rhipicephalus appendiculatus]